ncbi:MAG: GNAT family N-acetyltransferase [Methanomassiliicoccales archaeon]|nr:GNAT family N-acetyltransferase [Methanomassiliicoccales archaeon]
MIPGSRLDARFRRMDKRDIPALVKMSKSNMSHILLSAWGIEWKDDTLVHAVLDPDSFTEVLEIDEEIVGYFTVIRRIDSVFIISIQLHRQYQQQGLGSLMMARIEEWGERYTLERVELWVQSTNDIAIKFYEHLGYKMAGRQGNNYLMRKTIGRDSGAS